MTLLHRFLLITLVGGTCGLLTAMSDSTRPRTQTNREAPAQAKQSPDIKARLKSNVPIPGRAYRTKHWSRKDLEVDPLGQPGDLAGLIRNRPGSQGQILKALGGGTQDIGEIAVLEDDGTLVDTVVGQTNTVAIVNKFYETHGDEYDQLILFTASTYAGDIDPEAGFAFFQISAGVTAGINRFQGIPKQNQGLTRLLGWCNMNDLPEYPASFSQDFFGLSIVASGVEILGQEFEHEWGAFVQVQPSTGADILGRGNAHWSFFLHHPGFNNASPMEGNRWRSLGGGIFETTESFTGLSELDEYLMGLRTPEDIVPFYVIDFVTDPFADSRFPALGVQVTDGTRIDLSINDIIANHGPRLPDTSTSQKTFKVAFVLVIPPGTLATVDDLAKIDSFRTTWENYFRSTTENLGIMDTTLGPNPEQLINPFAIFDAESDNLTEVFEYVQGATIDESGQNEPSGTRSLRMNGGWGGGDEVRSKMIDLTGYTPGELRFSYAVQRTGFGDAPEAGDDLSIDYFTNLGDWVPLNVHLAVGNETETTFTAYSKAIPPDGYHNQFRYRLRKLQGETQGLDDWYVDDIHLDFDPTCSSDLTLDQLINVSDMLELLMQWGACPFPCILGTRNIPDDCAGDTNRDCKVDIVDLLALLAAWGTCMPDNDDCADSRFINSGSFIFDTTGATTDGPPDCPQLEKDIWFCYLADCTGVATITLCGTTFDARMAVYDSCDPGSMQLIECGITDCGPTGEITLNVMTGQVFKIRVGGADGATGAGVLTIDCTIPIPVNDQCIDAIAINDGDTFFSTLGASTDGNAHSACSTGGDSGVTVNDIWYTYTATCTGTLTVSTCGQANYDSDLVLYNPGWTCPPTDVDLLACNDDDGAPECTNFTSRINVGVQAGTTYLLRVGGWREVTDRGTGTLSITCTPPPDP